MSEYVTLSVNVRNATNAEIKLNGQKSSAIMVKKNATVLIEVTAEGFVPYKAVTSVPVTSTVEVTMVRGCDCGDIDKEIDEKIEEATSGLKDEIEKEVDGKIEQASSTMNDNLNQAVSQLNETIEQSNSDLNGKIEQLSISTDEKLELKANAQNLNEEVQAREQFESETENSFTLTEQNIKSLENQVKFLADRVSDLSKTNPEVITPVEGQPINVNDQTKDVIIEANFAQPLTATAKSVEIKNAEITANTQQSILINATEETTMKDCTVACNTANNTNVIKIQNSQYITIRDMVFTGRTYNTIMTGQTCEQPIKMLTIENCEFREFADHVNIWAAKFADDAVVTISNCHFYDSDEQVLALSNEGLAKNITINMVNCVIDKCETGDEYEGFILCQDYNKPKTAEGFAERHMFKEMTINLTNVVLRGEKLTPETFKMGTASEGQCLYVYGDKLYMYDPDIYPTVNVM